MRLGSVHGSWVSSGFQYKYIVLKGHFLFAWLDELTIYNNFPPPLELKSIAVYYIDFRSVDALCLKKLIMT